MKKSICAVMLLMGTLAACSESREGDDNAQMRRDDMAPIQYSDPDDTDTMQQNEPDTAKRRINNIPGRPADSITTQPYGTGTNI
ncbi:hypothetical protein [Cesiribacter sp. SM1]|uniref:hypothetical protein n=1 Tax=Cesiribacter sp. SM1 TaxID=2861196 RepID=UPI001CD5D64D|nr:hypothetical protein [Cesiribacter sp. SM1]